MTSVVDTFDRTDNNSSLGATSDGNATWSAEAGTWGIASNQALCLTNANNQIAVVDTGESDGELEVTLAAVGINAGAVFRYVDTSNYWVVRMGAITRLQLVRVEGGAETQVFTTGNGWAVNGRVVRVVLDGDDITVFADDTQIGATSSSVHASATKFGMRSWSGTTGARWDDFSFTGSAVAPVDLIVDDASHGHAADNLTLTFPPVELTVADATHAHTADNLTLTQTHILAVDSALHGHTADNVPLEVPGQLVVADATHTHTADNLTLTQTHLLVVDDALHGHTADNLTLSLVTELVVHDATHGHTADNITLTFPAVDLVVHDATHAHTADEPAVAEPIIEEVQADPSDPSVSGRRRRDGFASILSIPPAAEPGEGYSVITLKRVSLEFPDPTLSSGRPV